MMSVRGNGFLILIMTLSMGPQIAHGDSNQEWINNAFGVSTGYTSSQYVPKRQAVRRATVSASRPARSSYTTTTRSTRSSRSSAARSSAPRSSSMASDAPSSSGSQAQPVDFKDMSPLISDGKCRMSSPFGMRNHPITGGRRLHAGCDIATATGTPIRAPADGTVKHIKDPYPYRRKGPGNVAWIKLGNGHNLRVLHMSRFGKSGQVKKGDVIGYVGSTGSSTGPHMHLEVYDPRGRVVNPLHKFRISQLCRNIGGGASTASGGER